MNSQTNVDIVAAAFWDVLRRNPYYASFESWDWEKLKSPPKRSAKYQRLGAERIVTECRELAVDVLRDLSSAVNDDSPSQASS